MDYIERMNAFGGKALKKTFNADTVQNPVTYEKYEEALSDGTKKYGFKATSSYNSWSSCATRLVTYFYVITDNEDEIIRDFDSNGIPSLWIPKGMRVSTFVQPKDTAGMTNTQYKESKEPSNERAGVNVEVRQFNNQALHSAALNVMRQERPDLFDFESLELEDLEKWWLELNSVHVDTVSRVLTGNLETYFPTVQTERLRGGNAISNRDFNQVGLFRIDSIYGYDWESEVEGQRSGWEIGKGDDFMGLSWEGLAFWSLTGLYWALNTMLFFRATLTYTALPKATTLVGKASKLGLAAVEVLAIDTFLLELPYYIRSVDATTNHNNCGFPAGGHYESVNIHVYDPSLHDWKGTPHCKAGETRKIVNESPLEYDPKSPCCPENTTYNKGTSLCEGDDSAVIPSDGLGGSGGGGQPFAYDNQKGQMIVAGAMLGLVGLVMLTGSGGSKE